jgi:hypothetical protein
MLAACLLTNRPVGADPAEEPARPVWDTITLSATGDTHHTRRIPLFPQLYQQLKSQGIPATVLAQQFGLDVPGWLQAENLHVTWDDPTSTILLQWSTFGTARMSTAGVWELPLEAPEARLDLLANKAVTVTVAGGSALGPTLRSVRVNLPAGSSDIRLLQRPARVAYRLPAPPKGGKNADAHVTLVPRSHLLGCLAQVYAEPKFGLWGARMVLKNSGDQVLKDYRVRFQVTGFSPDWGPWQRCPLVVPGQTVVDPWFPVLDVEKVARLEGARPVFLKAQYQYRRADGTLVDETETVGIQLLGRNLVEFGSEPKSADLVPFVFASVVTYQDPVMQQLAGRICRRIGGSAASLDPRDALRYMEALYDFMGTHIAYQTSPGDQVGGRLRQHVKFGRDVLTNHSGTCIDLAILFASACETVGLEPIVVLVPGHAFPAVKVGTQIVPLESTMIGRAPFAAACKKGQEEWNEVATRKKPGIITFIKRARQAGLQPLELPTVAADWLAKICPEGARPTRVLARAGHGRLVGVWHATYRLGSETVRQTMTLKADGTCSCVGRNQFGQQLRATGTYQYTDGVLTTQANGHVVRGTLRWIDDDRIAYTTETGRVIYRRIRTRS